MQYLQVLGLLHLLDWILEGCGIFVLTSKSFKVVGLMRNYKMLSV